MRHHDREAAIDGREPRDAVRRTVRIGGVARGNRPVRRRETHGDPCPGHLFFRPELRPAFAVDRVGLGLGTKDPAGFPNALRVWLGELAQAESASAVQQGEVVLLETNLDDMNPQFYDYVMERLFAAGALDVYLIPIQMKKNRPGNMLSVLCPPDRVGEMLAILFAETTTLGVRVRDVTRRCLDRSIVAVDTRFGQIRVKVARRGAVVLHAAPEYDDCKAAARRHGVPLSVVYEEARRAWTEGDRQEGKNADHYRGPRSGR